ncbi:MAG: hypothetical protein UX20_C0043G0003 [Candidatus Magasanikbacteria bacterium GW2011_GWC2_45_8]|uniref:Uncharacterized protein n=1 Tax=Candidatus Magasanikbacteria bacterium GW2011_GWC2_45_8 TaxID=1619050 RepID=A0A0G1MX59_9BACT|nr:MAG: hypothetical protein UX20_C0043G0003 [Candidatus Magasanikbacteria bacterium GW2011_GWC2_45_8]
MSNLSVLLLVSEFRMKDNVSRTEDIHASTKLVLQRRERMWSCRRGPCAAVLFPFAWSNQPGIRECLRYPREPSWSLELNL